VPRGPAGNLEIGSGNERLPPDLERERRDREEQRERHRQGEARDARRTEPVAHEAGNAFVCRQLLLHRARRCVHRTVRHAHGVAIHECEHGGGDDGREDAGQQQDNEYEHRSPKGGRAPRFFPRGRVGNRTRLTTK